MRQVWKHLEERVDIGSGPIVAGLFARALGLVMAIAFASLAVQVPVLIGERGLQPAADLLARLEKSGDAGWSTLPSIHRFLPPTDAVLTTSAWLGAGLGLLALLGFWPRIVLALGGGLYLSLIVLGRSFFAFQWDNLLLECALLAAFLPQRRAAPWMHFAFRVLVFKLYWLSGIAKWQSPIGDWRAGTAMASYYETAPLPTALAYWAHHLPSAWHRFESFAVLWGELLVPIAIFLPRRARLGAFGLLTAFQLANLATANYGIFCWLALALHLFLLRDEDFASWVRRWPCLRVLDIRPPGRLARAAGASFVALWLAISTIESTARFGPWPLDGAAWLRLRGLWAPYRVVNVYHLFGQVTTARIEPDFEIQLPDGDWQSLVFHYKPGPLDRAPGLVAPHQPRVDFRLWFFGLSYRNSTPDFVVALMERLCLDPVAVGSLFENPPMSPPQAVRVAFWRYHFTDPEAKAATDAWWTRDLLGESRAFPCEVSDRLPPGERNTASQRE